MKRFLIVLFITLIATLSTIWSGGAFATQLYDIDKDHTSIGFSVKHLGVSNVKGFFGEYSGSIQFDEKDITKSSVDVTIQTVSINTNNVKRDEHLRTGDFFDVAKHPTMI